MDALSMENLWTYLQGLSLTADNWQWLANKTVEKSFNSKTESGTKGKTYRISPRRKRLMERVKIDPNDYRNDERAQYIFKK